MFSDIGSGFKSMVGGEIKGLSKLTRDTRHELIQEASEQAQQMGANAITGIRIETNTIFDGTLDMVFYGTAVAVKRWNKDCFKIPKLSWVNRQNRKWTGSWLEILMKLYL